MLLRSRLFVFVFLTISFNSLSQEKWDLKRCIDHALQNNLQIKKTEIGAKISKENVLESKAAVLPSVNGFATHNYNFGQTIDPFTNQFASTQVQSNSFTLSGNLTLFSGLQNWNNIQKSKFDYQSSLYNIEKIKNDVSLNVAAAYLQVLFNEELTGIAKNQLEISKQQADRTKKFVDVGSMPKGNLLDLEAQLAADELSVVNFENQLIISYLNLKQLLEIAPQTDIEIAKPEIQLPDEPIISSTPGQVFDAALITMPQLKSAENKLYSSEKMLAMQQGRVSPTLTLNGSYGSGYSGLRKDLVNATINGADTVGFTSGGDLVYIPTYETEMKVRSFENQFKDNLNQSIGFRLTIPIFNGLTVKTSVGRAKLALLDAEYDLQIAKNQLRKEIEQAHADAVAALKKHKATKKSVDANQEAFNYMQQRFDAGMANSVEYSDSKNNLAKSQSDLLQAKYDYIFKTKILDFYQGRSLVF